MRRPDTLPRLLAQHAATQPRAVALQEKRYGIWQPVTWTQYAQRVHDFAYGLAELGVQRGEVVAVLDLGDLDVGAAQGADLPGVDGLHVLGRDGFVDDLVQHYTATEPVLQNPGGRLARTETRDAHLRGQLAVSAVEVRLELVERHLDVDPDARRAQPLDGALHGGVLLGGG